MGQIIVDVGDYKISGEMGDVIKTFALGSCVAVMIYDQTSHIAGMIHIALPDSAIDQAKAMARPAYFADTGLALMIEDMKKLGVTRQNIWIKIAGGANIMDPNGVFDIGKRNVLAVKKVLWKSNLGPVAEDIGGDKSRTVYFSVETGAIVLSHAGKEWEL